MNIGLFGYGKMGKMIEQIAQDRGHTIVAKIDDPSQDIDYSRMDVAIDFSTPEAAFDNITTCFKNNIPVISGTTGWLDKFSEAINICKENKSAFIYASNFSLGVNIFFELNNHLAKMMAELEQYKVSMEEIHHIQKLDAPSGTAITLAEGIIENTPYESWALDKSKDNTIAIKSIREGVVPGTHSIFYKSTVDTIEIKHEAHNREGFALGAVIASEWIHGKTGVFSMKDVLNLS
ncbi:MAG: 4-hydroxy-tetrahydrodipicolinate reductase [Allomuricauda sp.]|jgi:4-hydroxy-tetrahydrodipicolinate reductase